MVVLDGINPYFPVGNAAGWCKSVEEVERLSRSAAEVIVVGSITMGERQGNPGNTWNNECLNSLGLPNPGIEKIVAMAPKMIEIAHKAHKKIILSIAGFSVHDYIDLSARAKGFDGIEINVGCPNVADEGIRKPIFSFDLRNLTNVVDGVLSCASENQFVTVKVSPMSNPMQILETADTLVEAQIDGVVTQNAFPNALLYNGDGTPQIQTPDGTGWAGLSGSAVKAMALGQVNQWRKALNSLGAKNIPVWGVGGVESARDVRDMLRAGASVVQVGTAYFRNGPKVFSEIASEI